MTGDPTPTGPGTVDPGRVALNLAEVRARIEAAGGGDEVQILAVTKGFGPEIIDAAVAAGCSAIGENYAQELLAKRGTIDGHPGLAVHFIGQLQSNKVRQLAGIVALYETVDRVKLVRELARRDPGAAILLQVDTSTLSDTDAPGKGGCPIAEIDELAEAAHAHDLELRGLMSVGPTTGGPDAARAGFEAVRAAVDRLGLPICSIGMTDDLEVAVACGSTQVRVGTALFGSRPVPIRREQER